MAEACGFRAPLAFPTVNKPVFTEAVKAIAAGKTVDFKVRGQWLESTRTYRTKLGSVSEGKELVDFIEHNQPILAKLERSIDQWNSIDKSKKAISISLIIHDEFPDEHSATYLSLNWLELEDKYKALCEMSDAKCGRVLAKLSKEAPGEAIKLINHCASTNQSSLRQWINLMSHKDGQETNCSFLAYWPQGNQELDNTVLVGFLKHLSEKQLTENINHLKGLTGFSHEVKVLLEKMISDGLIDVSRPNEHTHRAGILFKGLSDREKTSLLERYTRNNRNDYAAACLFGALEAQEQLNLIPHLTNSCCKAILKVSVLPAQVVSSSPFLAKIGENREGLRGQGSANLFQCYAEAPTKELAEFIENTPFEEFQYTLHHNFRLFRKLAVSFEAWLADGASGKGKVLLEQFFKSLNCHVQQALNCIDAQKSPKLAELLSKVQAERSAQPTKR